MQTTTKHDHLSDLGKSIDQLYRADETHCVESLIQSAAMDKNLSDRITARAVPLIENMRSSRQKTLGVDVFLHEYSLSTEEGVALMCLAEALLRIPDNITREKLINDKISTVDWHAHRGKSDRLFINAATWGLMLTGNMMKQRPLAEQELSRALDRALKRGGRTLIMAAMKVLGKQFVLGRDIEEALARGRKQERQGFRYSFDMLGEAAITAEDATRYFAAYSHAIQKIGESAQHRGPIHANGISIKLSALHPRYEYSQRERVFNELYPRLRDLIYQARDFDIGVTIDAEEADRLTLSLALFEKLFREPSLANWSGLGLAVQSYQKRAPAVIDWLSALAKDVKRKIMIRLIKGAYWDYEIKDSQVRGLSGYPVFTRKIATDVSFLACARKILAAGENFYPQFATHNAHTVAAVLELLQGRRDFEFQCLHGMGQGLYDQLVGSGKEGVACRVYAPVGEHEQLLPYLVRRLLENGANSSFVNRIHDESISTEEMASDPIHKLAQLAVKPHPNIPLPKDIFGTTRLNSQGIDMSQEAILHTLQNEIRNSRSAPWRAYPVLDKAHQLKQTDARVSTPTYSPADRESQIGMVEQATLADVEHALAQAELGFQHYLTYTVEQRAQLLENMAQALERQQSQLMSYCVYEAGKTLPDALAEVREAVDFCRYYAKIGREQLAQPEVCAGVTGEKNLLSYHPRGIVVAISPWNFPLAIFIGQISAALMAGNVVIAKPAEQTSCIATYAVNLFHEAGFPPAVIQCCPGRGEVVGAKLVSDERVRAVIFTGSTETARLINQSLANKPGPITALIAETGGQNAMFVDSSALLEQVVKDVLNSAFGSAGQRCSACRIVFIQDDIADRFLAMLQGAMAELSVGLPDDIRVDVGPVIDDEAKTRLEAHIQQFKGLAKWVYQVPLADTVKLRGTYIAPTAFEIEDLSHLQREIFGPVLHIVRYKEDRLAECLDWVHKTGYGLTMGVHSRIDSHIRWLCETAQAGNIYVNRNMIGAVVGVQPFGGEGLSGTGPKAGGPNYLKRLCVERCVSTNTTATGGNASLLMLASAQ